MCSQKLLQKAVIFQQVVRAWAAYNIMTLVYYYGIAPVDGVAALTANIPTPSQSPPA